MLNLWRHENIPTLHSWESLAKDFDGVFKEMDKVIVPFKKGFERLWSAPADIHETEKSYLISLDLPGLKKEEINVEVTGNHVSIYGERKVEQDISNKKSHRLECWKGQFRRTFALPDGVETQKVDANYENGVLQLNIPKLESSAPKKVAIK